jgi:hypothetical protein
LITNSTRVAWERDTWGLSFPSMAP